MIYINKKKELERYHVEVVAKIFQNRNYYEEIFVKIQTEIIDMKIETNDSIKSILKNEKLQGHAKDLSNSKEFIEFFLKLFYMDCDFKYFQMKLNIYF